MIDRLRQVVIGIWWRFTTPHAIDCECSFFSHTASNGQRKRARFVCVVQKNRIRAIQAIVDEPLFACAPRLYGVIYKGEVDGTLSGIVLCYTVFVDIDETLRVISLLEVGKSRLVLSHKLRLGRFCWNVIYANKASLSRKGRIIYAIILK